MFVGGGVAHGPKGAVYKIKKINKKVRKLALAQTLSKKNSDKNLHILADVKKEIKKTKEFNKFLLKTYTSKHQKVHGLLQGPPVQSGGYLMDPGCYTNLKFNYERIF